MRTRREFLQEAVIVPLVATVGPSTGPRIIAGRDCLSQESAEGYRAVLRSHRSANLIVICGAIAVHPRLQAEAANGAWVIWEPSPYAIRTSLGIVPGRPVAVPPGDLYVRYSWPHSAFTRSFSHVIPVSCPESEAIAHYAGAPFALRRRIGNGGVVFLGSMLGPNLRAEEREARELASAIFSRTACGGTSTTALTNT